MTAVLRRRAVATVTVAVGLLVDVGLRAGDARCGWARPRHPQVRAVASAVHRPHPGGEFADDIGTSPRARSP